MSKRPKLSSNKVIDEMSIPPKPLNMLEKSLMEVDDRKYIFRLTFINGSIFNKFLLPIANAVHEMRFTISKTDDFMGLKLAAHDTYMTLANKSRFECDVEIGDNVDEEMLEFSVSANQFMQTLSCSSLKDTVLTISKYSAEDSKITFESLTNEKDVHAVYTCDILAESRLHQSNIEAMEFNFGFHINLCLKTIKELIGNAKRCGASHVYFELFQANENGIEHSKLNIGFKGGQSTSGAHEFYTSSKKVEQGTMTAFQPIPITDQVKKIKYTKKSFNEYDNNKLRLFLNHMDMEWIMLHLCNDNSNQPLVMECLIGGQNSKHLIIVAPKLSDSNDD